ncbi:hypothetical protein CO180_01035 [candidate division WWE3 bacterium CG_4_9_14_3_um_filter_41_6]|uniref:LemA family protein n=1 Tax=candidate division WWE3 bacterium CG_4_10_14_0_2_um_filter_41_14 TaxID=1975072 RepID=A0A2M7TIR9_UNCKA|nr:MAG: hypothetical protein COY32_03475 [candidate division WWE3 bacterium CG_4_10_14_0_2_um_filter_41_14]PJA39315.1 MAG: hypothetical protein CO180_01035 [candidate division WWE3 bacterium CG_4_9_14_3_um_filter_41_6]
MKSSIWIVGIIVAAYLILGSCTMSMQKEGMSGKQGEVWNQSARAIEVLPRLEREVEVFMSDRQDVIGQITAARVGFESATENHNLQELAQAQGMLDSAIKVIVEAYPTLDLSTSQIALMDETAGSLNRIAYARQKLIETQVSYNKSRIIFFPLQPFFPRAEVTGENYDPTTTLPPSTFGRGQ